MLVIFADSLSHGSVSWCVGKIFIMSSYSVDLNLRVS